MANVPVMAKKGCLDWQFDKACDQYLHPCFIRKMSCCFHLQLHIIRMHSGSFLRLKSQRWYIPLWQNMIFPSIWGLSIGKCCHILCTKLYTFCVLQLYTKTNSLAILAKK